MAESCTGGLLAARLTDRAGSSEYFAGGAVVYSNEAKVDLVGVEPSLIETHGAVSIEVARALADGARRRFGTSVGVGITGIAGPGGGTPEKPVGLVCFSVTYGDSGAAEAARVLTRSRNVPGDRVAVRERSTTVAMHLIARVLGGESDSRRSGRGRPQPPWRWRAAARPEISMPVGCGSEPTPPPPGSVSRSSPTPSKLRVIAWPASIRSSSAQLTCATVIGPARPSRSSNASSTARPQ